MNAEAKVGGVTFVLLGVMTIVFRQLIAEGYLRLAKRVFGVESASGLDTSLLIGGIMLVAVGIMSLVLR